MPSIVFIGLAHWHVGMHLAGARRAGLDVLGGWDPDPARAASHGVASFPSLEAALQAGTTLACVTGTPLEMPERLRRTAQAGVPALVEKTPLPRPGLRCGRWRKTSQPGAPGSPWRSPTMPAPCRTVDCGDVRHLSVRLVNGRPARYRTGACHGVLDPAVGGGGALRNLGVHGLDLARLLLGPQVRVTGASLRRWHGEAVEDHAVVHLAAPGGATATVEAGYLHPDDGGSDFEARLMGTGAVAVDTGHALVVHASSGAVEHRPVTPQPSRYDDLMADVARRAAGGHPTGSFAPRPRRRHGPDRRRIPEGRRGMTSIGVGLIGAGSFGAQHAMALPLAGGFHLVGACRESPQGLDDFIARHGGRAYRGMADLLADPAVEAVVIATPHDRHEEAAVAAARAGKAILLEKPLAPTLEACDRIAAAGEDRLRAADDRTRAALRGAACGRQGRTRLRSPRCRALRHVGDGQALDGGQPPALAHAQRQRRRDAHDGGHPTRWTGSCGSSAPRCAA